MFHEEGAPSGAGLSCYAPSPDRSGLGPSGFHPCREGHHGIPKTLDRFDRARSQQLPYTRTVTWNDARCAPARPARTRESSLRNT